MKKVLFILLTFATFSPLNAQTIHFLKSYGNTGYDYGRDIKQTVDTGYICTGSSSSFGSGDADVFLLKVDSLGNFKWSYNYGGPGSDWGQELVITEDSSYAVGGYTNSFGAGGFDFYLVRAAIDGTPIFEKTYGGSDWDKCNGMARVPQDSGFVLVGETFSFGAGGKDVYIVRTNKFGDTLWTKTYGGALDDYANAVLVDGDSIVVVGGTESFGAGMEDGLIIKMGINGNFGWDKFVGEDSTDYFTSLVKFSGTYYLGGTRDYHNGIYLGDFWVYRMSTDGSITVVDTSISNASHEFEVANDIVVAQAGNIYFAGSTKSFGYSTIDLVPDAFVGKLLSTYFTAYDYRQNFGEAGVDIAWGIDKCYDQGTVAIGDLSYGSTGGNNIFIIKLNQLAVFPDDGADYDIFGPINNDITTGIDDVSTNLNGIKIFPNPVNQELYIQIPATQNYTVKLFDISGRKIEIVFSESNGIMMENLENGMYIVFIEMEGQAYSYKVIKN